MAITLKNSPMKRHQSWRMQRKIPWCTSTRQVWGTSTGDFTQDGPEPLARNCHNHWSIYPSVNVPAPFWDIWPSSSSLINQLPRRSKLSRWVSFGNLLQPWVWINLTLPKLIFGKGSPVHAWHGRKWEEAASRRGVCLTRNRILTMIGGEGEGYHPMILIQKTHGISVRADYPLQYPSTTFLLKAYKISTSMTIRRR
jgi:hypothetical protein